MCFFLEIGNTFSCISTPLPSTRSLHRLYWNKARCLIEMKAIQIYRIEKVVLRLWTSTLFLGVEKFHSSRFMESDNRVPRVWHWAWWIAAAGVLTCSELKGPVGAGLSVWENVRRTRLENLRRPSIEACWGDKILRRTGITNSMSGGKSVPIYSAWRSKRRGREHCGTRGFRICSNNDAVFGRCAAVNPYLENGISWCQIFFWMYLISFKR